MSIVVRKHNKSTAVLSKDIKTEDLMLADLSYSYSNDELYKDWERLKRVKDFKSGSQFKPGMKICQHFFDNFFDIKAHNGKCFRSVQNKFDTMDKIRTWGLEKMSALYVSWIRRAVYMASGMHNPTYYRPHLAKQIILSTGKKEGILFDPCAGWGGRMLGTVAAGWQYIGCEPNKETYNNLLRVVEFLGIQSQVTLYNLPFEDLKMDELENVDIILTSPPYFNLERYSDEENQSYNKFLSFENWKADWYIPMIEKCIKKLNINGLSCWNVMDFKGNDMVNSMFIVHEKNNMIIDERLGIDSPFINYKKKINNRDLTYIFAFTGIAKETEEQLTT